jgi:hypothetical protein
VFQESPGDKASVLADKASHLGDVGLQSLVGRELCTEVNQLSYSLPFPCWYIALILYFLKKGGTGQASVIPRNS